MKARLIYFFTIGSLIFTCAFSSQQEHEGIWAPMKNRALTDFDEVYIRIMPDRASVKNSLIDYGQLEKELIDKFSSDKLKIIAGVIVSEDDKRLINLKKHMLEQGGLIENLRAYPAQIPELIVHVGFVKVKDYDVYAFNIQTSLARTVFISGIRSPLKGEIWRIDVPIGIATADKLYESVKATAHSQVHAFVKEWQWSNTSQKRKNAERKVGDAITSATGQYYDYGQKDKQLSKYGYCASEKSKIFHKANCRWAQKISGHNLIHFESRDRAIASGKRPCKTCNP